MSNPRELIANFLQALFDSEKMSKSEFSRITGIGRSTIDGYLNCQNAIGVDQLEKIASAIGIQSWELLKPPGAESTQAHYARIGKVFIEIAAFAFDDIKFQHISNEVSKISKSSPNNETKKRINNG